VAKKRGGGSILKRGKPGKKKPTVPSSTTERIPEEDPTTQAKKPWGGGGCPEKALTATDLLGRYVGNENWRPTGKSQGGKKGKGLKFWNPKKQDLKKGFWVEKTLFWGNPSGITNDRPPVSGRGSWGVPQVDTKNLRKVWGKGNWKEKKKNKSQCPNLPGGKTEIRGARKGPKKGRKVRLGKKKRY